MSSTEILLSKTKLIDSFSSAQFILKGNSALYRLDDRNIIYVQEDITSRFLKFRYNCNIESISVEINLRLRKWFINGSYNPSQSFIANHLKYLNCIIDECSKSSQNFFVF